MSQFVLIDHSLSRPGSHHFEYARHVLQAAHALGFRTVLGCNRRFEATDALPEGCRTYPVFVHSTYGGSSITKEAMNASPSSAGSPWGAWLSASASACKVTYDRCRYRWRHGRRLRRFADTVRALLDQIKLCPGDQVFVPTLSEFDLLGLSRVLASDPAVRCADWHLQFHFSFLEGRETDWTWQAQRVEAMRDRFRQALRPLRDVRLHFYCTTPQMAAQYNRLEVVPFRWLPYPVDPRFRPLVEEDIQNGSPSDRPLRIVSAGSVRGEKGSVALPGVVERLWPQWLENGKAQIVLQGATADLRRVLSRPFATATNEQIERGQWPTDPLIRAPFPLAGPAYSQLIRQADMGLFLYDSYRYYGRCSGILVEMLCSGIPVVVPAGCWLDDELREVTSSINRETRPAVALRLVGESLAESRASAGTIEVDVPETVQVVDVLLRAAAWHRPRRYACGHAWLVDYHGRKHDLGPAISAPPANSDTARLTFAAAAGGGRLRLKIWNAFQRTAMPLETVAVTFRSDQPTTPTGTVGVSFAEPEQACRAVREVADHLGHYQTTAREISHGYRRVHSPAHTVEQLLAAAAAAHWSTGSRRAG